MFLHEKSTPVQFVIRVLIYLFTLLLMVILRKVFQIIQLLQIVFSLFSVTLRILPKRL